MREDFNIWYLQCYESEVYSNHGDLQMKKSYDPNDLMFVVLAHLVAEESEQEEDCDECITDEESFFEDYSTYDQYYEKEDKIYVAKVKKLWDPIKRESYNKYYIIDEGVWLCDRDKFPLSMVVRKSKFLRVVGVQTKKLSEEQIFEMEVALNKMLYGDTKTLSGLIDEQ